MRIEMLQAGTSANSWYGDLKQALLVWQFWTKQVKRLSFKIFIGPKKQFRQVLREINIFFKSVLEVL